MLLKLSYYAGPFTVKTISGRVKNLDKFYVRIFNCLVVKAFEIVHNLTNKAVLRVLLLEGVRLLEIFSDNASNFMRANNHLQKNCKNLFKNASK